MFLLFDIGGTKMRLAVSYDGKNIRDPEVFETPRQFAEALEIIKKFVMDADSSGGGNLYCAGLPGVLDRNKSTLVTAPNLANWVSVPIKQQLEDVCKAKVRLENDAYLAGLGEAVKGAGAGKKIVAYITVGTGVGGVRIVDGRIDESVHGFEPGHQLILIEGAAGKTAHELEDLVAGAGMEMRFGKKPEEIEESVWREAEEYLAIGLVNTILHWSCNVVVLGGGLIINGLFSLDAIREKVGKYLKVFPDVPEITKGTLGDNAGLEGALILVNSASASD